MLRFAPMSDKSAMICKNNKSHLAINFQRRLTGKCIFQIFQRRFGRLATPYLTDSFQINNYIYIFQNKSLEASWIIGDYCGSGYFYRVSGRQVISQAVLKHQRRRNSLRETKNWDFCRSPTRLCYIVKIILFNLVLVDVQTNIANLTKRKKRRHLEKKSYFLNRLFEIFFSPRLLCKYLS